MGLKLLQCSPATSDYLVHKLLLLFQMFIPELSKLVENAAEKIDPIFCQRPERAGELRVAHVLLDNDLVLRGCVLKPLPQVIGNREDRYKIANTIAKAHGVLGNHVRSIVSTNVNFA